MAVRPMYKRLKDDILSNSSEREFRVKKPRTQSSPPYHVEGSKLSQTPTRTRPSNASDMSFITFFAEGTVHPRDISAAAEHDNDAKSLGRFSEIGSQLRSAMSTVGGLKGAERLEFILDPAGEPENLSRVKFLHSCREWARAQQKWVGVMRMLEHRLQIDTANADFQNPVTHGSSTIDLQDVVGYESGHDVRTTFMNILSEYEPVSTLVLLCDDASHSLSQQITKHELDPIEGVSLKHVIVICGGPSGYYSDFDPSAIATCAKAMGFPFRTVTVEKSTVQPGNLQAFFKLNFQSERAKYSRLHLQCHTNMRSRQNQPPLRAPKKMGRQPEEESKPQSAWVDMPQFPSGMTARSGAFQILTKKVEDSEPGWVSMPQFKRSIETTPLASWVDMPQFPRASSVSGSGIFQEEKESQQAGDRKTTNCWVEMPQLSRQPVHNAKEVQAPGWVDIPKFLDTEKPSSPDSKPKQKASKSSDKIWQTIEWDDL